MYMNYPTSTWTIYFESQRLRDDQGHPIFTKDGKMQFDKPEPLKVTREEMAQIFETHLMREKKVVPQKETAVKEKTQKIKEKEITKQQEEKHPNRSEPDIER